MAAKYSDRFRQPATPREDILDYGGADDPAMIIEPATGDEPPTARPRPWHASRMARIALVLVFALGAAAGAYGWDRLQDHQATVAAMGQIDLTATTGSTNYGGTDTFDLELRYSNEGDYAVTIHDVDFAFPGADVVHLMPAELSINPGESGLHHLSVAPHCGALDPRVETGWFGSDNAPDAMSNLVVTAESADGTTHKITLPWNLPDLSNWLLWNCQSEKLKVELSNGYGEIVGAEISPDQTSVRAVLVISAQDGSTEPLEIADITSGSEAFQVEHTTRDGNPSRTPIELTYRIGNCSMAMLATEEDLGVTVRGRFVGGNEGTLYVGPSITLASELGRLSERACGSA